MFNIQTYTYIILHTKLLVVLESLQTNKRMCDSNIEYTHLGSHTTGNLNKYNYANITRCANETDKR